MRPYRDPYLPPYLPGPCIDMCSTCNYVHSMARMIQVRNVPDALHRSLKARAAMAGMSLSDYLLGELREIAERPTLAEFRERLHKRKPLPLALDTSGLLREERTARGSCSMPLRLAKRWLTPRTTSSWRNRNGRGGLGAPRCPQV